MHKLIRKIGKILLANVEAFFNASYTYSSEKDYYSFSTFTVVSRVSAFFEEVSSPMVGGVSPYTGYNTYVQLQRVW